MKSGNAVSLLAVLVASTGALGCGSSTPDTPSSGGKGLGINASLGIDTRDRLIGSENSYTSGSVLITNNGTAVSDATVTLNEVALPLLPHPATGNPTGFYSANSTTPIAGGSTLALNASEQGQTAALSLPCPNEVSITSPKENTTVKEGQVLTVTWSGSVDVGNEVMIAGDTSSVTNTLKPSLHIYSWNGTANGTPARLLSADANGDILDPTATSGTITVPSGAGPTAVLELHVAGKLIEPNTSMAGQCNLSRRVVLPVAAN
jgi:hypothetical protein